MTPAAFKRTLTHPVPPKVLAPALTALWWAKRGDWEKAHRIVMDEHGRDAAKVHAYLHRVEGDEANARYWYTQARRRPASGTIDDEWDEIVVELSGA